MDESRDRELKDRLWSIRPVEQEDEQQSLNSDTSSPSSQPETSFTSTDPTTISEDPSNKSCTKTTNYLDAYQRYRLISLQSRKLTQATSLHIALDKTQLLTNQLHVSTNPLNRLLSILYQLPESSTAIKDLREQATTQRTAITHKTEDSRLAIRNLLKTNQPLIRECEVLLKDATTSNLSLFTQERLAVNRLLTTMSSNENVKIEADEGLELQQDVLAKFNEYVGGLIESLEMQNKGLEAMIGEVNQKVRSLEGEIDGYVRDKRSLRKMLWKMFADRS